MTLDDETVAEAFEQHEGAPTWQDDPVGRDAAIRWHLRGFEDGRASRDAEVEELRATLAKAREYLRERESNTAGTARWVVGDVLAILEEGGA